MSPARCSSTQALGIGPAFERGLANAGWACLGNGWFCPRCFRAAMLAPTRDVAMTLFNAAMRQHEARRVVVENLVAA